MGFLDKLFCLCCYDEDDENVIKVELDSDVFKLVRVDDNYSPDDKDDREIENDNHNEFYESSKDDFDMDF